MNAQDSADKALLTESVPALLAWYDSAHRDLPWRADPTPYHVWISEIMLQQTRVEAVKPYYARFLQALPDIEALANVPDDVLLKLWEGLGYYSRARNLKKAAQQIMAQGGEIPDTITELCKLSGIGSYTAGAIASIAYDKSVPAVDGNVLRIVMRLLAKADDIALPQTKKMTESLLLPAMPQVGSGRLNQAFMDLGATVCLPNAAPKCDDCPLSSICRAHLAGNETAYPVKSAKKPRRIEEKTVLIFRDNNRIAFRKRPNKGLLAGLYEFPWLSGHCSKKEVLTYLKSLGYSALRIRSIEPSKHIFTHIEWHMTAYLVIGDDLESPSGETDLIFAGLADALTKYPIPSAFSAYIKYCKENEPLV